MLCYYMVIYVILLLYSNITYNSSHCASQIIQKLHVPNVWSEKSGVTSSPPLLPTGLSHGVHLIFSLPWVLHPKNRLRPATFLDGPVGQFPCFPPSAAEMPSQWISSTCSHQVCVQLQAEMKFSWLSDHVSLLSHLHTPISIKAPDLYLVPEPWRCGFFPHGATSIFILTGVILIRSFLFLNLEALCTLHSCLKHGPYIFLPTSHPSFPGLPSS